MIIGCESLCVYGIGSQHMKMFRPNRDPPLDDAGTLVPVYHAVELLSAVHTNANGYSSRLSTSK